LGNSGTPGRGGADAGTDGSSGGAAAPGGSGSGGGMGGGGGAGGSGDTPAGPQPRVLVVDPATNRFLSYDRQGQIVRSYHERLDVGTGFGGRNVWVDGAVMSWDGPSDARAGSLVVAAPSGFDEPLQPSRILIRAQASPAGPTRVRVLGADSAIITEHTIAGVWEAFHLSPKRGYIYADRFVAAAPPYDVAAVIPASDGMIVAQRDVLSAGPAGEGRAAFARDDSRFVYAPHPYDMATPVRVLDPRTSAEVVPAPGSHPWFAVPNMPQTFVQGTVNDRAVLLFSGQATEGRLLYSIDWQGNFLNFAAPEMPSYAADNLLAVDPPGNKVMWSRQSIDGPTRPNRYAGSFQLDFTGPPATAWTGGDAACFGRPTAVSFKVIGTSLQRCACSDGTCTTIAAVPAAPDTGWVPLVLTNRRGSVVVVTYDWPSSGTPAGSPNIFCFSPTGQPLASAPYGAALLDETAQLLLIRPTLGVPREHAIVDLTRGTVSLIGMPPNGSARIIYE
jgi:hypothetical protein